LVRHLNLADPTGLVARTDVGDPSVLPGSGRPHLEAPNLSTGDSGHRKFPNRLSIDELARYLWLQASVAAGGSVGVSPAVDGSHVTFRSCSPDVRRRGTSGAANTRPSVTSANRPSRPPQPRDANRRGSAPSASQSSYAELSYSMPGEESG